MNGSPMTTSPNLDDALVLRPRPPFRLDLTVWALRRRGRNRLDRWDGGTYRRALDVGGRSVTVAVDQRGRPDQPYLSVGVLAGRLRGVKPPRFVSLFEALVNAIANQQLSLEVGIELFNRITEAFGVRQTQCGPCHDGFGLSDTRTALHQYFEVDAGHIVVAALHGLAQKGELAGDVVAAAIHRYGIDADAADPRSA